jgi:CBS domain-containing protein
MRARDLMSTEVDTAPPDAPLVALAEIMATRGVTGVPVVDAAGKLLGLVTESDILRRLAAAEDVHHSYLWGVFHSAARQSEHYARTHGHQACDIMSVNLITATEDTSAEHIAKVMEEHKIRHVPVVRDSQMLGLVTRAHLLRGALALLVRRDATESSSDADVRRAVIRVMREQPWADIHFTYVDVEDGVVTFSGFCSEENKRGLRALAEEVPGVKDVVFLTTPSPRFWIGAP